MSQQYLLDKALNIPGLTYISEYISPKDEEKLLALIDFKDWDCSLQRRTQHYGYKYDYKARYIDPSHYLGEVPYLIKILCNKLCSEDIFTVQPDQVIVNEYMPGQGIAPHIDCIKCFTDVICSLSLLSGCFMDLTDSKNNVSESIYLEPRSLLILRSDARYKWKHSIAARKSDNGSKRQRRISITFRKVII